MRFEIITIFPGFFAGIFEHGIVRRAQAEGLVGIGLHDLRAFTHDRHRTVDDRPFGGGEGMVLKPEPLAEALGALGIEAKKQGSGLSDQGSERGGTRERGNKGTRTATRDSAFGAGTAVYAGSGAGAGEGGARGADLRALRRRG